MEKCTKQFDKETLEALMRLPAFRYMKAPVDTVAQLYERYPDGNERGTFAFVLNKNVFYAYQPSTMTANARWVPISIPVELPDPSDMIDGDAPMWDSEKEKFVVVNLSLWGKQEF